MIKQVSQSHISQAVSAHKKGELKSWVESFLSQEKNQGLLDAIRNTTIKALTLTQFPLDKINKIQGPEIHSQRETLDVWENRVSRQVSQIKKGHLPAPLIVTDFWWPLEIADGNHRHEALVREGFKSYWTIFIFKNSDSLSQINHQPKITTILTDVGGVLVRTESTQARQAWEKKLGLAKGQLSKELYGFHSAIEATLGRTKAVEIWQGIKEKFNLTSDQLLKLQEDFHSGDRLNTGLCNYLNSLRPELTVAIFSNAWDSSRQIYKNKFHLDEVVDQMIISAEVGLKKPDSKFYQYALETLNAKPESTIFIDDDQKNIFIAEVLGIRSILFTDTLSTTNTLKVLLDKDQL